MKLASMFDTDVKKSANWMNVSPQSITRMTFSVCAPAYTAICC